MKRNTVTAVTGLLLAAALSGCGGEMPPGETEPSPTDQVQTSQLPEGAEWEAPAVPQEPVYTTLPDEAEVPEQLLLQQVGVTPEEVPHPGAGEEPAPESSPQPELSDGDQTGQGPVNLYLDTSQLPNAVTLPAVYGAHGDTVSVPLKVEGQVELCGLDIRVRFDPERLKFAELQNKNPDVVFNCHQDEGVILLNYMQIKNQRESFLLGELSFEVTTWETCRDALEIEVVAAAALDPKDQVVETVAVPVEGLLWLNQPDQEGGG